MTGMQDIRAFLAQKRFAFVGVSRQQKDFSREPSSANSRHGIMILYR